MGQHPPVLHCIGLERMLNFMRHRIGQTIRLSEMGLPNVDILSEPCTSLFRPARASQTAI